MKLFTINKILCPTDFSEPSYVGLKTANDLALHYSAELILVHVVAPLHVHVASPLGGVSVSPALYPRGIAKVSEKSLEEAVKDWISPNLRVRTTVLKGNPADQIVDLAQSERLDMIVTATHGWTGWRRFISGRRKAGQLTQEIVLIGDKSTVEVFKETVQGLSEEVARLERAEPTLRESEEKYKKLVEDSLTCIYSGQKGRIQRRPLMQGLMRSAPKDI